MDAPYTDFVGQVWTEFPQLAEWHNLDKSILPLWNLDKFVEAGYHNFSAERKALFHVSKLIEDYAQKNSQPLLASFEEIKRYKFVEKRYQEMIKTIPKIWVIANFGKTEFKTPPKIQVLNCGNTNLAKVWTVITRGPYGPFGLIAEEFEDGMFRGFFTLNPNVCRYALKIMGKTLGAKFTIQ
ncbi:MAG: hypothetical protein OEM28_03935 [Nitrosopumilus sp.]|nr:hypothetical protein [Nitrosopumilus sp.]MDH3487601.1 hypothetical protein [Nitrosopumilus sp.]